MLFFHIPTQICAAEEEPRLKYQRLEGDVPHVLRAQAAARLCVSDKLLALGTASGSVHLLDYAGNEVGASRNRPKKLEIASVCVSDKLLAQGPVSGSVHLLDYAGNEVGASQSKNNLKVHSAA